MNKWDRGPHLTELSKSSKSSKPFKAFLLVLAVTVLAAVVGVLVARLVADVLAPAEQDELLTPARPISL